MAVATEIPPEGAWRPDVLLIHPPAAKPAEPPLGAAALVGHLRSGGARAWAIDANLEAYLFLLCPERLEEAAGASPPTSLRRAVRHASRSLAGIRSAAALGSFPRYAAAVRHLNRALGAWRGEGGRERLTLGDYLHGELSEFVPADLRKVADGRVPTLFSRYFGERLLPRLEAMEPRLVGISINYRHQVLPAFELAGLIRRRLPGIPLVAGGGLISSLRPAIRASERALPPFDALVVGPGEGPLAEMAAGGPVRPADSLRGGAPVCFRPDFDGLPLRGYLSPVPVIPVSASRGCYWRRCLFCPEAASPTQPFACMPPRELPDLLLDQSRRHRVLHFHLADDAIPVGALEALAARKRDLEGLSWHGFVRFEPALLDGGFVRDLAGAGCAMLHLGLESGSQRVLDRLGKGTRLHEASAILRNLARAGIGTYVYVMVGTPGERPEDREMTLRFLEDHAEEISQLNVAVMNLPRESALPVGAAGGPGRPSFREDGAAPLRLYRPLGPAEGRDRGAARRFLAARLLRSPSIREIVRRSPPLFTSNHAFLFWRRGAAPAASP